MHISIQLYIGSTGYGLGEMNTILDGGAFCMGGPGVILSQALLKSNVLIILFAKIFLRTF